MQKLLSHHLYFAFASGERNVWRKVEACISTSCFFEFYFGVFCGELAKISASSSSSGSGMVSCAQKAHMFTPV